MTKFCDCNQGRLPCSCCKSPETFAQVVGRYTTLMLLCYAAIGLAAAYWL